jgi:hypothetical protein
MHMPTVSTVLQSVTAPVVDTGNINLTSIPEIGPEEDIAINVSLSIKEKIQRGEYVDLSTLLSMARSLLLNMTWKGHGPS